MQSRIFSRESNFDIHHLLFIAKDIKIRTRKYILLSLNKISIYKKNTLIERFLSKSDYRMSTFNNNKIHASLF